MNTSEALISEAASRATYVGAATATIFGLSASEWQVLGVVSGIFIGLLGLAVNFYFQLRRLEAIEARKPGDDE
jgi:hypothetical protein